MKYIKSFNESLSGDWPDRIKKAISDTPDEGTFQKIKGVVDTLKDICVEIQDEGYTCKFIPNNDISLKVLGLKAYSGVKYKFGSDDFKIGITKKHPTSTHPEANTFLYSDIKDTMDRILNYMKSEGWETQIDSESCLDDKDCEEYGLDPEDVCDYVQLTFTRSQDQ